jgi:GT2 family glycosyltransferase
MAQSYERLKIVVVDSASSDGTASIVRTFLPSATIIESTRNLGYAGGNNLGIRHAWAQGADAFLLLNNDLRLAPDCVEKLVNALTADPLRAAVGPMVYTWDNWLTISSAGGRIRWSKADAENVGIGEDDYRQFGAREVDFLNGCALLVSRDAIERTGLLDEAYFMYWEETDWCMRMQGAGLKLWFEPTARVQHKATINPGRLSTATYYYMARNRIRFFARYGAWSDRPRHLLVALSGISMRLFANLRAGRLDIVRAEARAIKDAFFCNWGRNDTISPASNNRRAISVPYSGRQS